MTRPQNSGRPETVPAEIQAPEPACPEQPHTVSTIVDVCREYLETRDLCDDSYRQVLDTSGRFVKTYDQLTPWNVNGYLRELRGRTTDTYRRNERRNLLYVARHGRRRGYWEFDCSLVVRIKAPILRPRGYTARDMQSLLDAVENHWQDKHYKDGTNAYLYWHSFLLWSWNTGMSRKDTWSVELSDLLLPSGEIKPSIVYARSKTTRPVWIEIWPETAVAIPRDRGPRPWALWSVHKEAFEKQFRKLRKLAGVQGTVKWIRAGSGSSVEATNPGWGHVHLGNTPQLFDTHYRVEEIVTQNRPMPERIG